MGADFFFLRREVDEMISKHAVTSTTGENTLHSTKAQHILTLSISVPTMFFPIHRPISATDSDPSPHKYSPTPLPCSLVACEQTRHLSGSFFGSEPSLLSSYAS